MLGQFTGEEEPDGGLDLPGGDGGSLIVVNCSEDPLLNLEPKIIL